MPTKFNSSVRGGVSLALLVLFAGSGAMAAKPVARECLVPLRPVLLKNVEGRLDHLAFDPSSQRLFVAALENHSVEVIDLAKGRRVHQLTGLAEPQGLAVIPAASRLLVCSRGDGTCRSFDARTFAEGPWIDLGRNADNVRFDVRTGTVLVGSGAEPGLGLLSAIDRASLLPASQGGSTAPPRSPADLLLKRPRQADALAEAVLPAHPESFQIAGAQSRVFVNVPDEHQIAVLALSSNGLKVVESWPVTVAEKNFPMTLDAEGARLFVTCRKPPCVAVYEVRTGKMLAQTPCVGDADDTFFDAVSRRLFVIGGEGFVDVFQAKTSGGELEPIARAATAPRARTGLFIPELKMLAVAAPHTTKGPAEVLRFSVKP